MYNIVDMVCSHSVTVVDLVVPPLPPVASAPRECPVGPAAEKEEDRDTRQTAEIPWLMMTMIYELLIRTASSNWLFLLLHV